MSRLAGIFSVDPSVITYRVGRMERMGYAQRTSGDADRFVTRATITPSGSSLLRRGRSTTLLRAREHFFAHVPAEDLSALTRLFTAVAEAGRPDPTRRLG